MLKDIPLPTILVVAGIIFILLSVASQLSGKSLSIRRKENRLSLPEAYWCSWGSACTYLGRCYRIWAFTHPKRG
jgi:hypothetical protein